MSTPMESVQVKLTPSAGFCIKSVTTTPGFFYVSSSSSASSSTSFSASSSPSSPNSEDPSTSTSISSSSSTSAPNPLPNSNPSPNPNLLEPTSHPSLPPLPSLPTKQTQIPKGVKVFLNVAWDRNVPPPPEVSEDVIRRAMAGADLDDDDVGVDNYGFVGGHGVNSGGHGTVGDERGSRTYYVPVIVSEPKETTDKSGKPSIVFDCIFSSTLKGRCSKDKDFKLYIVELALEHVEQKVHLTLSREVGTPNIASKGKVEPRTVLIPRRLVDASKPKVAGVDGREVGSESSSVNGSSLENKNTKIKKEKKKEKERERSTELNASTSTSKSTPSASKTTPTSNLPKSILKSQSQSRTQSQTQMRKQTQTQSQMGMGTENTPPPMPNSDNDNDNATSAGKKKPPLIEVLSSMSGGEVTSDKLLPETETGIVALNMEEKSALGLGLPTPRWRWTKEEGEGGRRLKIEIEVPNLTRNLHTQSTLDIEARRILLHIPEVYYLDINLDLPDAQIGKIGAVQVGGDGDDPSREDVLDLDLEALRTKGHNAGEALRLKRQRDFDVEGAKAEWRINDRKLNIFV